MSTDSLPASSGGRRRWRLGLPLLVAALAICVLPGAADAKKKRDKIGLMTYNLYLGSDLGPAVDAINAGQGDATPAGSAARAAALDAFANEVGFVLGDVNANNFDVRAKQIAKDIQKKKADLVGLQEAALWKVQIPTDLTPLNPAASRAGLVSFDYVDKLLEELNAKAKTGKQCKKQDIPKSKCYKGYKLVVVQQEADLEFFGDFDNDAGPNGVGGVGPNNPAVAGGAAPACGTGGPGTVSNPGADDSGVPIGLADPGPGPAAANFDYNGDTGACTLPSGPFASDPFVGTGAGGTSADCPDTVGGLNPATSTCLLHGIDGDASLTMRDAIIARKGAGVKANNPRSANYANFLAQPLAGGAASVNFTRGWTAVDAKVRGKSFTFVNTHLESESDGSIREDQASELVAAGGPASGPNTVLVGDLNSDPTREPTGLPDNDGGSKIAIDRLFAAGFSPVTQTGLTTGGHGELLSDQSNLLGDGWIDHILTNNPSQIQRKGSAQVIDTFANGLWNSDHGGVLVRIKGKKKK